jgi:predicted RND superfamily exporter protein
MTTSTKSRLLGGLTWPIDHPRLAAAILALIVLGIGLILPHGVIDFSLEQLYPKDSPMAHIYQEHQSTYGKDDTKFFAVRLGDAFDPAINSVEQQIRALPGVEKTSSPFSIERLDDVDGVLAMRGLQPSDADVLTRGTVLSLDDTAGGIIIEVADDSNHHEGRDVLLSGVESIIEKEGGTWHLAGMPVIRTAYVRLVLQDLLVVVPLSVLIAAFFFVASFRDWRQVLLGVSSISIGMLASAAAYVAAGGVVNTFSPAFFSVVVVVGTSDLIHLVHRFSDHVEACGADAPREEIKEAARRAAREIGFACLLTTATTTIGFLALTWTDLPTIQMFGMGAGVGVIITYLITFLLVPPVLAHIRPPSVGARRHATESAERMARLGSWAISKRKQLLTMFVFISLGCVWLGSQTELGYRLLADLGTTEAAQAQDFMEDHMGAVLPMAVDIRFEGDAREPEALAAIDELTRWLRSQPLVGHAVSVADLARESYSVLSGEPNTLPPTHAAASQALFMLSMGADDPVSTFLVEDGSRTRILLRVRDEGGNATVSLVDQLQEKTKELIEPIGGQVEVTGVAYVIQWINRTLTNQFVGSFGIALILIGGAWMVTTRSIRRVAVALIPNVLPLLAVLAALGALGIPLKPTTAMVFSIGLGIAVDDTIHFLTAYERWRRAHPEQGAEAAAQHAYSTAGRSMLDTSIVLTAGMMAMAASEFTGFLYLGMLTAWSVVAALFTDLLLLGPLLVALDKQEPSETAS